MFGRKRYIFNEKTLSYEIERRSFKDVALRGLVIAVAGLACFLVYFYLYTGILGFEAPKTVFLENRNRMLVSDMEYLSQKLDAENIIIEDIQKRDNLVYRPVFGMDSIPVEARNAGFGGIDKYSRFSALEHEDLLVSSAMKMDVLSKKVCIQSKSFDDVCLLADRAGEMASCVPSINPLAPSSKIRVTSSFGYRMHPIRKSIIFHEGMDFSGPMGEPVYATGSGVVEKVSHNFFGYGNCVVVDHGFGYKTRYAHLREINVAEGQKVLRGDQIATLGNSGQSTGAHLHYEVIYMGRQINPWHFLLPDVTQQEYASMVRPASKR